MFGNEYLKISKKKLDSYEATKKGIQAESLAFEFLKLTGKKINDVRRVHILEGTLKRPDFIIDNTFIEVKNYYIKMLGLGKLKGYRDILRDYLGKGIRDKENMILEKGIIISLAGFSPEVVNQSKIYNIIIFGPEDLEKTFKENGRNDLIQLLKH
jgi:hypothetical protein